MPALPEVAPRPAPCPHRPPCPGCPRYGEGGPAPGALARLAALAREAGLAAPEVETAPAAGHRHRARLMVRGRARSPKVGLFQEGSHRIVDIPRCRVHHPRVNEVAAALRRAIRATGTPPYADVPHAGLLRAVQVVVERAGGGAQVVLVTSDRTPDATLPLARALRAELGCALHSLFWNGNPERTNVILGPHWERIAGPPAVRERVNGVGVHFPPGAFGQSHLDLADRLAARVAAEVPDGARAADLYAGCGALGLGWLARAAGVVFNERSPAGLEGLATGLAERPAAERERARVVPGRAGDHPGLVREADVVVADPPRKGLDPELLEALRAAPPERLVYVACGLDAFLAQARALLDGGRVALRRLAVLDCFPWTRHVETLAVFERRGPARAGP